MSDSKQLSRRGLLGRCVAAAGTACAAAADGGSRAAPAAEPAEGREGQQNPQTTGMPYGTIGNVRISRLLLGGNLVSGYMHARDLKYVTRLFRAYVTEEKILETFKLAEEHGKTVTKPWIAFKVLAAGAIHPRQGFAHAIDNGADFIGVGMFDFQVEENCDLVRRLVKREQDRARPWRA